jgi:hypothetical protein
VAHSHDIVIRVRAGGALAGATLRAAAVLVAPVVLWARFGDGSPPRTIAVVIAAMLLCCACMRLRGDRRPIAPRHVRPAADPPRPPGCPVHGLRSPRPERPETHLPATTFRRDARRPARAAGPSAPAARACRPGVPRRAHRSRTTPDVRCAAASRPHRHRRARRRTRP